MSTKACPLIPWKNPLAFGCAVVIFSLLFVLTGSRYSVIFILSIESFDQSRALLLENFLGIPWQSKQSNVVWFFHPLQSEWHVPNCTFKDAVFWNNAFHQFCSVECGMKSSPCKQKILCCKKKKTKFQIGIEKKLKFWIMIGKNWNSE